MFCSYLVCGSPFAKFVLFSLHQPPRVAERRVNELKGKFSSAIEEGFLEIIVPHPDFYPDLSNLPLTFSDPPERVYWRTKQNLDYSYLMMYAHNRARFYCQLEDDIVATMSYASTIQTFAMQQEANEWFMLEFSSLGFIGKYSWLYIRTLLMV